jgi:uncharacterized protein (TIGR02646 family)
MLSLTSNPLSARAVGQLNAFHNKVTLVPTFSAKVDTSKAFWKSTKKSWILAKADINKTLISMCVGVGICNYCENNEATDIEHIFPKSFFPEKGFIWENYLLACKTCNTHYKLDKIAVFSPSGSLTRHDVVRGSVPITSDVILINPRIENPLDFIELNLRTGIFLEKHHAPSREYQKASYTIEVLSLNLREALREARESRARDIYRKLQYAVSIAEATTFGELDTIINLNEPFITLDHTQLFVNVKVDLINSIRKAITNDPHPTVWIEIKKQQASIPNFAALFNRLPIALTW